jgi:dimeric dUTPase (all-alpha-NTP-PPase superfamily)
MKKHTLEDVFEAQKALNQKIQPDLYELVKNNEEERVKWLLRFELAMRQECAELIDSVPWKWWKKQTADWGNVKVELVDILHFWVSMCTVAGVSADEVMDLYFKKNNLNHKRQDGGYKEGTYDKNAGGVEDNIAHVLAVQRECKDKSRRIFKKHETGLIVTLGDKIREKCKKRYPSNTDVFIISEVGSNCSLMGVLICIHNKNFRYFIAKKIDDNNNLLLKKADLVIFIDKDESYEIYS